MKWKWTVTTSIAGTINNLDPPIIEVVRKRYVINLRHE
jgi:hypothetical protein